MSFFEEDNSFTELADEEERRKTRRTASAPFVRFLIALGLVIVVVAVGGLLIPNWFHSRKVENYHTYIQTVSGLLTESDAVGEELFKLLTEPGESTRKELQTQLDAYMEKSKRLTESAKETVTPDDMLEAHQWFVATMQLRSRGLENLKPSLMSALEVRDLDVSSEKVTRAMQLLVLSDVAYEEFFATRASSVLQEKEISGVTVPGTRFISDSTLASQDRIKGVLNSLKTAESLQSVHGVALIKVQAFPADMEIVEGETYDIQLAEDLRIVATVENQGNMEELDVPVTLTLDSPKSTQPQIITVKIPSIKPKEQEQVTLSEFDPADYGETALLKVEAGPVPEEKLTNNNALEAHVIFVLGL